jgi:hypothetical protein
VVYLYVWGLSSRIKERVVGWKNSDPRPLWTKFDIFVVQEMGSESQVNRFLRPEKIGVEVGANSYEMSI